MKKYIIPVLALAAMTFTACENAETDFPDYEGGVSVYFSYQYPVRTIELGEDTQFSTELDNAHKFLIRSAMGGAYENKNIKIDIKVDNSLCDNLYFAATGEPVKPMPESYYRIEKPVLTYSRMMGGCEVTLTDEFFADPKSLTATYGIPVLMTGQKGADHIITGTPIVDGTTPARTDAKMWSPVPQDFAIYVVRYVNPWHGTYLVKEGDKEIDKNTKSVKVITTALNSCSYTNLDGKTVELKFDGNSCSITAAGANVGSGEFKKKSEIKAWGNKDRDALYLTYSVDGKSYTETLVAQMRTTEGDPFNTLVTYEVEYK